MNKLEQETKIIYDLYVQKFGPPDKRGTFSSLKELCEIYTFWNNLREKYQITDFNDEFNIQMSFYIGERSEHTINTSYILFGLSAGEFLNIVSEYTTNKIVPNITCDSIDEMNERIRLKKQDEIRNAMTDVYSEKNGDKPFCIICGDTESLIHIVNHEQKGNHKLCRDCMRNQHSQFGVNFTKVKNGKAYIKK